MARLFVALLAIYVVLEWTNFANGLATLLAIILVLLGSILAVRLIRQVVRKSIWRLRNRLIMTYVFIGMVPIVLILALAAIGTYILVGQVAAYLVSSELERRAARFRIPFAFCLRPEKPIRTGWRRQWEIFYLNVCQVFRCWYWGLIRCAIRMRVRSNRRRK